MTLAITPKNTVHAWGKVVRHDRSIYRLDSAGFAHLVAVCQSRDLATMVAVALADAMEVDVGVIVSVISYPGPEIRRLIAPSRPEGT